MSTSGFTRQIVNLRLGVSAASSLHSILELVRFFRHWKTRGFMSINFLYESLKSRAEALENRFRSYRRWLSWRDRQISTDMMVYVDQRFWSPGSDVPASRSHLPPGQKDRNILTRLYGSMSITIEILALMLFDHGNRTVYIDQPFT